MSKIKSFKYVGKCGIIAKISSRQNGVGEPGIIPVL